MYRHGRIPGRMDKVGTIIALSLIIIAIITIIVLGARGWHKVRDFFHPEPEMVEVVHEVEVPVIKYVEKEVVISADTVQSGIRAMGKLCTSQYYFTHVSSFEESVQLNSEATIPGTGIRLPNITIPGTKKSFVYSYDGTVIAGIDFEQITVEKDDIDKRIVVKLPAAEIISSSVDPDTFKLYDEKTGLFTKISVSDVMESFASLIEDEENKAIEKGVLGEAQDNAAVLIENFVKNTFGLGAYKVVVNQL